MAILGLLVDTNVSFKLRLAVSSLRYKWLNTQVLYLQHGCQPPLVFDSPYLFCRFLRHGIGGFSPISLPDFCGALLVPSLDCFCNFHHIALSPLIRLQSFQGSSCHRGARPLFHVQYSTDCIQRLRVTTKRNHATYGMKWHVADITITQLL